MYGSSLRPPAVKKSIREEIEFVKKGFGTKLVTGHHWYLYSTRWFGAWKEYTEYDSDPPSTRPAAMTEALNPGPVDNSDLLVAGTTVLKPGLLENKDYVLLPAPVSNYFLDVYKGGPIIFRSVINMGSIDAPILSVEVYPLDFQIWLCRRSGPLPVPFQVASASAEPEPEPEPEPESAPTSVSTLPPPPTHVAAWSTTGQSSAAVKKAPPIVGVTAPIDWVASKTCTLGIVCSDVKERRLKLSVSTSIRCWVKASDDTEPAQADVIVNDPDPALSTSDEAGPPTPVDPPIDSMEQADGRLLTADATEVWRNWRLVREPKRLNVIDLAMITPGKPIEVIMEISDVYMAQEDDWPRAADVQAWKSQLVVGDVIDAQDLRGTWYESVVRAVHPDGSLSVHFKGWEDKFDETFPAGKVKSKIAPLYAKTSNWRARIEEDSGLDVKIILPSDSKIPSVWLPGVVDSIDVPGGKVRVKYSVRELETVVATATAKIVAENPPAQSAPDTAAGGGAADLEPDPSSCNALVVVSEVRDESVSTKRRKGMDEDSEPTSHEDDEAPIIISAETIVESTQSTTTEQKPVTPTHEYIWLPIQSERVCQSYTHCPRPTSLHKGVGGVGNGAKNGLMANDYDYYLTKSSLGKPLARGVVGLVNLGNTCYMNSILQCLSNTYVLTEFFITNKYKEQLNTDNPLGHNGKLAQEYAKLMKEVWSDGYSKVVPRSFKKTIGEFQPQFADFSQQDSQELMLFLLDGLHEDLNRIKRKPYAPKIESNGRPDDLVARESWRRYLLRNDSAIVDSCYGQGRSHVTCTTCATESVTFEPFSCLSLPIPVKTSKPIGVLVNLLPLGSTPLRVVVEVTVTDSVGDVKKKVFERLKAAERLPAGARLEPHHPSTFPDFHIVADYQGKNFNGNFNDNNNAIVVYAGPSNFDKNSDDLKNVAIAMDIDDSADVATAVTVEATVQDPIAVDAVTDTAGATEEMIASVEDERYSQAAFQARSELLLSEVADELSTIFHVCSQSRYDSTKINKCLGDEAPAGELLRAESLLVIFQLEHPCPVKPLYMPHGKERDTAPTFVSYVDVYTAIIKQAEHLHTVGKPARMTITATLTGSALYAKVDESIRRFVRHESRYYNDPQNRPYTLVTSNAWASLIKSTIEDNDTVLNLPHMDVVVIVLKPEADTVQHIDTVAFALVEDLPLPPTSAEAEVGPLTIYKCLEKYTEREQLGPQDTIYCRTCADQRSPLKKMDLWMTPDILIIQLKRFQFVPGFNFVHREKITELVDYPLVGLDLTPYLRGPIDPDHPPIYDLFAVSNHEGGLNGGHYTANCLNPLNNKWYNFNDSVVSEIASSHIISAANYVLFFKRRGTPTKWGGMIPLEPGIIEDM